MPDTSPYTGVWDVDAAAYHADTAFVNHSSLEVLRKSPRRYHARYVAGTLAAPAPSEAMQLGTWLHRAVLEPERWPGSFAVRPEGIDRRTKQGKLDWEWFQLEAAGKDILTGDQAKQVLAMRDAVLQHPLARGWLSQRGLSEQPIRWQDPTTGLWCKALLDRVCGGVVFDLKTATEPTPDVWARSAAVYGYHRQSAHYLAGVAAALDLSDALFVHVLVGSTEPYEVFAVELDAAALAVGHRQRAVALERLRLCREQDTWDHPAHPVVTPVSLPKWCEYEE